MPNYKNGKIYCIRSYHTDKVYVGSTTRKLCQRMPEHKTLFKNNKMKYTAKNILKYDDAYIELIEEVSVDNIEELKSYEKNYIRNMNCVNKILPNRTIKEWNRDNKKKIYEQRKKPERKLKDKKWREENKEHLEKYKKEYFQKNKHKKFNCICGVTGKYTHKTRHEKSKKHKLFVFNLHNELNHL